MDHCRICGGLCPSGTLDSGLCFDCDNLPGEGDRIFVSWGRFGTVTGVVTRVTRGGTVYAKRWKKTRGEWTKDRRLYYLEDLGVWSIEG